MHDANVRTDARYIEFDFEREVRHRNKLYYRFLHWPIWIFVFFISPGPLIFDLIEQGFRADGRMLTWLSLVLIGTAAAGVRGRLPGCEPRPYIIRFTEDRPNPLYRRVCYTAAWGEVVAFAVLNVAGLAYAVVTGEWRLEGNVRPRVFSDCGNVLDAWRGWTTAQGETFDEGRGPRTTVFLWVGMGRSDRPACIVGYVEGVARWSCRRRSKADGIRWHPGLRGPPGPARNAPAHQADCSGTAGCKRLVIECLRLPLMRLHPAR